MRRSEWMDRAEGLNGISRLTSLFAGAWIALLSMSCSSFEREWNNASPPSADCSICGAWSGIWLSDVNGHTGKLRCVLTKTPNGDYDAKFHATFWKIFRYATEVTLHQDESGDRENNGKVNFHGEEDLG